MNALEIKVIAGLLAFLAAAAFYGHWHHRVIAEGEAITQARWDAQKVLDSQAIAKRTREVAEQELATELNNQKELADAQAQTALHDARSLEFVRRVRDGAYEAGASAMRASLGGPAAPAAPEEPGSPGSADARLAAYDRACQDDATQLNALINEIRPQLKVIP